MCKNNYTNDDVLLGYLPGLDNHFKQTGENYLVVPRVNIKLKFNAIFNCFRFIKKKDICLLSSFQILKIIDVVKSINISIVQPLKILELILLYSRGKGKNYWDI